MQEVFEKIKEKIRKEIEDVIVKDTYTKGKNAGLRKAEVFVDEVAAEYNNGWIPCSEWLPEESLQSVMGWDEYRERICFVHFIRGRFILGDDTDSVNIIAWQPLPAPYNPSGEHKKKTNFDLCRESMEAMAQIIDIAKIGWTKEQIMEWLQKEECEVPE